MAERVRLSEDLKKFLRNYHNHTQRIMYDHAKKLVEDKGLRPSAIHDIVDGAYTDLAVALAEDSEVAEFANSLISNPRKVGFYFVDEYVKQRMSKIADGLKQLPAYSVERDFEDSGENLTFGQNFIANIFGQRCGIGDREDTDNRLSRAQHSRMLDEEYIPKAQQPVSLDVKLAGVIASVGQEYEPKFSVSNRGVRYKGIRAPVLIK